MIRANSQGVCGWDHIMPSRRDAMRELMGFGPEVDSRCWEWGENLVRMLWDRGDISMRMWRECGVDLALMLNSHQIRILNEFSRNSHKILNKFSLNSQWILNKFSLDSHWIIDAFSLNYHGMLRESPVIIRWECGENVVWTWLLCHILTKFELSSNSRVILAKFSIHSH